MTRRTFVQLGVAGMASVPLASVLQARDESVRLGREKKDTSIILIWLDGGPSHLDMYDMKPDGPSEFRSLWRPIRTNVPGIEFSEMFPKQARVADKFSIVRSLHHDTPDHFSAAHWMVTGHAGERGLNKPGRNPSIGSIVAKTLGPRRQGMPAYASVPIAASIGLRPGYFAGNYLGVQYNPFETDGDPNQADFKVRNLNLLPDMTLERLEDRRGLLRRFDDLQRRADASGGLDSANRFQRQAFELVSGPLARRAFDINSESPKVRDLYGRNNWGQSALLARRLVEAGSTFVTVHFPAWDHHTYLEDQMRSHLPRVDGAVSALLEDIEDRGLREKVLVAVCGEFGRTPRISAGPDGTPPGRDHWPGAMFCLLGGGGVQGGRVIGATDARGEHPTERPLRPGDLHATFYDVLGVDPSLSFLNRSGRPIPIVESGDVIHELF
jgi:hypothetical protein